MEGRTKALSGYVVMVGFIEAEVTQRFVEVFGKDRAHGFLKVFKFDSVNKEFLFFGTSVKSFWSMVGTVVASSAMTEYVGLTEFLFRRRMIFE